MKRSRESADAEENIVASDSGDSLDHDDTEASPVQCWSNAVNTMSPGLVKDVKTLWKYFGGDRTTAKSFWVEADAAPRCQIESLALSIADFHLKGYPYKGVEVWTQIRGADQPGLGFHFDKDEFKAKENVWKHPLIGTATYFTSAGAPLVVFATASEEGNEQSGKQGDDHPKLVAPSESQGKDKATETQEEDTSSPSHAWICYPEEGRHVAFAGNLLHGVPEELGFRKQSSNRISLLANVWLDHKPDGIKAMSKDILDQMSGDGQSTCFRLTDEDSSGDVESVTPPLQPIEVDPVDLRPLSEHVPGDTAPLPMLAIEELMKKEKSPPFMQISY